MTPPNSEQSHKILQSGPQERPKIHNKLTKNNLWLQGVSFGASWAARGHQNDPKGRKMTPRVSRIQVLDSETGPKMVIVTPFQTPTPRSKNTIVPSSNCRFEVTKSSEKTDSGPLAVNATNGSKPQRTTHKHIENQLISGKTRQPIGAGGRGRSP